MNATPRAGLAAALALAALAPMMFYVLPMFLGAVATDLGISNQRLGSLAFAEYAGKAAGTVAIILAVTSVSWRRLATVGILVSAACTALSMWAGDLLELTIARFGAGLGCGMAFALALVYVAKTAAPERYFGYLLALQTSVMSGVLWFSPRLIETGGSQGLLWIILLTTLLCLWPARVIFDPAPVRRGPGPARVPHLVTIGVVAIVGHLLWSMTIGGVWAYIERIGDANTLQTSYIGRVLSSAVLVSSLGGLAASAIGLRWGRMWPYAVGTLLMCCCLVLLLGTVDRDEFVGAAFLFTFVWNFTAAYQLGLIAAVDIGGRFAACQPLALAAGFGLGPLLVGTVLQKETRFDVAIGVSLALWALSALIFFAVASSRAKSTSSLE